MTKSLGLAAAIALLLGMIGCEGMQQGIGVISYDRGTPPILAKATVDGEYYLYSTTSTDPKVTYILHKGDPLGFKTGQTGQIIAVGGSAEVPLPDDDYVWKRHDDSAPAKPQ